MPQIESILCPVDFSEFSVNAYEYARSLAWHYKAKLFLQHVLYPFHRSFAAYGSGTDSYEKGCRQLRADAEEKLQEFVRRHARTKIRPQCVVQDGWVTDQILSLAEAQAVNLIVMGTHGLRGIDRLMLGSVTERVLRRARCPVLVVRKPAHHVIKLRARSRASPPKKDHSLFGFFRPRSSCLRVRGLDGQGVRRGTYAAASAGRCPEVGRP